MDKKDAGAMASPSAWIELPHFSWEALLAEDAPTVRFRKGQTLFSQGDAVSRVLVIEEGRVRLVLLSAAGHEKHLAIVGTHGMVGECSAFLDGRHSVTAVAARSAAEPTTHIPHQGRYGAPFSWRLVKPLTYGDAPAS